MLPGVAWRRQQIHKYINTYIIPHAQVRRRELVPLGVRAQLVSLASLAATAAKRSDAAAARLCTARDRLTEIESQEAERKSFGRSSGSSGEGVGDGGGGGGEGGGGGGIGGSDDGDSGDCNNSSGGVNRGGGGGGGGREGGIGSSGGGEGGGGTSRTGLGSVAALAKAASRGELDLVVRPSGWLRFARFFAREGTDGSLQRAWLARQPSGDSAARLTLAMVREQEAAPVLQRVAGMSRYEKGRGSPEPEP